MCSKRWQRNDGFQVLAAECSGVMQTMLWIDRLVLHLRQGRRMPANHDFPARSDNVTDAGLRRDDAAAGGNAPTQPSASKATCNHVSWPTRGPGMTHDLRVTLLTDSWVA
jgi:hypothetical protein